ncbi:DsbA family oxidoreductase [Pseudorhodoferax sp.]|uniref:DsbA family oxidoreductase n=1 Tax=Pseudorhodoferax sp. TaxID=1993553 RepID=UPI002DD66616|nr:DsbA family oxidoreductase [Pseudorhodoferax sp.]
MEPLRIDIVSDVVCPWCYIGKRRLEAALASPEAAGLPPVQISWHPFQLNPDLPAEGIDRKAYLEEKFGGPERAAEIYERVRAAGRTAGLELNIDGITRQPNTLAAHTLIAFAQQDGGDGSAIKERLLQAYFIQNRFIGDLDELAAIAREAGLDAEAARRFIDDPARRSAVAQADQEARQMGINGVPFFIFNRKLAVSGAQEPATLVGAMRQAVEQA